MSSLYPPKSLHRPPKGNSSNPEDGDGISPEPSVSQPTRLPSELHPAQVSETLFLI